MGKRSQFVFMFVLIFTQTWYVAQATAARISATVAPYFTNHMVLQRDTVVPVWGTAPARTPVSVSLLQGSTPFRTGSATTGSEGKWKVELTAMPANRTASTLVVTIGTTRISFSDVLIGDVWVLSGQSNINVMLRNCDSGLNAINTSGNYPSVRLYLVPQTGPLTESWEVSNAMNTPDWSGVGFFFAQELSDWMTDVWGTQPIPIGLIQVAKNGTPISDWTTYGGSNNGKLYRDKIRPLQPFAIRGVLWYQGEDDGSQESSALKYYDMLPGLITNWRTDWGQQDTFHDFSFYYVQLALIAGRPTWAILRDAQVSTLDRPLNNIAMACIIDVPTIPTSEIHPKDKQPVGERLARAARHFVFNDVDVTYSGPIRDTVHSATRQDVTGKTAIIRFTHTDGGLVTDDGLDPGPFLIAGTDGVYYTAMAARIVHDIVGDTVEVSSPSVPDPKSVRYCWDSYPLCNLFNFGRFAGDGLPASPFHLALP